MTTEVEKPDPTPETVEAEKRAACQHGDTAVGEKCHECDVMVSIPISMFGGAQSFADVDDWREAVEAERNVGDLTFEFREIMDNIFADDTLEMPAKLNKINSAIDEMKERVDDPEASKEIDLSTATAAELEAHRAPAHTKVTTKREAGADFKASDFASVGDATKPTTWKLRLAQERSGNFTVGQVGRAITAMQPSGFRGQRVDLTAPKDQVVSKIRRAISRTGGTDEQKAKLRERLNAVKDISFGRTEAGGSFSLKEIDGELVWIGVYSNAFIDHDDETLSAASHKEFIAHCEAAQRWPKLQLWHTPGTEFGETKTIGYADRFTVAMGTIDKGREDVARRLEKSGQLAMSHGFAYDPNDRDADGVFSRYRTHEISVLPAGMAANELTGWSLNTEEIQMFEGKQRDFFVAALGEDETKALEAQLAKASEAAEAEGMAFKDILTAVAAPDPAPEPKPEPKADPEGDKSTTATMPEGIAEMIKAVNDGFATVTKTLEQHGEAIEELQQSDAEKLAAKIRPIRIAVPAGASESDDTVMNGNIDRIVRDANKADQPLELDPND
ncbi:hypothetical protein LCGC14_2191640, partial [marine sediment metagenome]